MVRIKTEDASGEEVEARQFFMIYDLEERQFPANTLKWITLDKTSYLPGENANLRMFSSKGPLHILVEKEHRNEIQEKIWLTTENWLAKEYKVGSR